MNKEQLESLAFTTSVKLGRELESDAIKCNFIGVIEDVTQEAYSQGIEDAAKVCEDMSDNYLTPMEDQSDGEKNWIGGISRNAFTKCAQAIRELKG